MNGRDYRFSLALNNNNILSEHHIIFAAQHMKDFNSLKVYINLCFKIYVMLNT